jgi:hypothetical protein
MRLTYIICPMYSGLRIQYAQEFTQETYQEIMTNVSAPMRVTSIRNLFHMGR